MPPRYSQGLLHHLYKNPFWHCRWDSLPEPFDITVRCHLGAQRLRPLKQHWLLTDRSFPSPHCYFLPYAFLLPTKLFLKIFTVFSTPLYQLEDTDTPTISCSRVASNHSLQCTSTLMIGSSWISHSFYYFYLSKEIKHYKKHKSLIKAPDFQY